MVSMTAVTITGLLIEREQDGGQASLSPVLVVAGAISPEHIERTVRQALHHYFYQHGILADLEVMVEPAEQIEQELVSAVVQHNGEHDRRDDYNGIPF